MPCYTLYVLSNRVVHCRGHRFTLRYLEGEEGTERIHYGWDHYIADGAAFSRSFLCMEATYPYAIKTQRKTKNAPSRGLWVSWAVSLWHTRASPWSQPIRAHNLDVSRLMRVLHFGSGTPWYSSSTSPPWWCWPPSTSRCPPASPALRTSSRWRSGSSSTSPTLS